MNYLFKSNLLPIHKRNHLLYYYNSGGDNLEKKYYQLLKEKFPKKEQVLTELINLEAIVQLPKGTEHFVSDLHGEFDAFDHVLRNGSGSVKEKVKECFQAMPKVPITDLCTLIYYPEEKLALQKASLKPQALIAYYKENIPYLLQVTNYAGRKYTRSKVRKALPPQFAYIIEELLTEVDTKKDKIDYFTTIVNRIIELNQAPALITALCKTIQRLVVDHLHVVGDIYDRGPKPDQIMERLSNLPSVDIQWGNHDIVWLAAVAGSPVAAMNLLRISSRYGNLDILEERYGINLRPLATYAQKYYEPTPAFNLKAEDMHTFSEAEQILFNQIQQATAILQFKLEGQLILRRPEFLLDKRNVLTFIDYSSQTITLDDVVYPLVDFNGPTVDEKQPLTLTKEEETLIARLLSSIQESEKLKRHMDFMLASGSMYLCYNDNLLFHGCIPLHENGDLKSLRINGHNYAGKALLDFYEEQVRKSYLDPSCHDDFATDMLWYLWTGESSSLFGKEAMTTFERYYIADKKTHIEKKNAYYRLRNDETICQELLAEFDLPHHGHIINGHTPVKEKKGEDPIKANSKLIVIDGGYAKSYQKTTGIAGYTLLSNSYGMQLAAHQPFTSVADAVKNGTDIISVKRLVDEVIHRTKVKTTNTGVKICHEMADLSYLYQNFDKI